MVQHCVLVTETPIAVVSVLHIEEDIYTQQFFCAQITFVLKLAKLHRLCGQYIYAYIYIYDKLIYVLWFMLHVAGGFAVLMVNCMF